jgi:WD40 repeat protein
MLSIPYFLRHKPTISTLVVMAVVSLVCFLVFLPRGLSRERFWAAQSADVAPLFFSPDGKTLFSGGGALRLWDPATGSLKSTLPISVCPIAMSPAGDSVACIAVRRINKHTDEYSLEIWNLKTAAKLATINHFVSSASFSPDGRVLAAVTCSPAGSNWTIELWPLPPATPLRSFPRPSGVRGTCFSPDGKSLASAEGNVIELLDLKTGRSVRTFKTAVSVDALGAPHFSPDGQTLAAIGSGQPYNIGSLWTWDVSTASLKTSASLEHGVVSACYSADGKTLAVLLLWYGFSRNDKVEVWNTVTGDKIGSLRVRDLWMSSLALSPDGRHLAVGFQQPHGRLPAPIGIWRVR